MASKTAKIVGIILTSALLAGGSAHAVAAMKTPIEMCVSNAVREAPDHNFIQTVNHCYWDYWG
ncbi:MAG: hypothetical protein E4H01_08010 [Lysobacterales bacterium]|nr:MAG: hypothetical protein E4H01_08010 [Xanthomonadales bacterium]